MGDIPGDFRHAPGALAGDHNHTISVRPDEITRSHQHAALPRWGFLVESPTLIAFHARRLGRLNYGTPTLFVMRSEDGKPLASSSRVRIYRGFGDRTIQFRGRSVEVETELFLP